MSKTVKHVCKTSRVRDCGIIWVDNIVLYDDGTWELILTYRWPLDKEHRVNSSENIIGKTRDELKTLLHNLSSDNDPEFIIMI